MLMQGWEVTVIKQEQSSEGSTEMKIALPSMPSLYITSFIFQACLEIHKVGGHVLDKSILRNFAGRLMEKVCINPIICINILCFVYEIAVVLISIFLPLMLIWVSVIPVIAEHSGLCLWILYFYNYPRWCMCSWLWIFSSSNFIYFFCKLCTFIFFLGLR